MRQLVLAVALVVLLVALPSDSYGERGSDMGAMPVLHFALQPLAGEGHAYGEGLPFDSAQEELCRAHGFERKAAAATAARESTTADRLRLRDARAADEAEESSGDTTGGNWAAEDINHELKSEIATLLEAYEGGRLFELTMLIGSAQKAFRMLVDTTSRQFVVPSANLCDDPEVGGRCSNGTSKFNALASITGDPVSCTEPECTQCITLEPDEEDVCAATVQFYDYEDREVATFNASLVNDVVYVQQMGAEMQFGAYYYQSDISFPDPSFFDGIVGFGPTSGGQTSTDEEAQGWLDQLAVATGVDEVFSLCLSPVGGLLSVGGSDVSLFVGGLQHVPYTYDKSAANPTYNVIVNRIEVDGQLVSLPIGSLSSAVFASSNPYIDMNNSTYDAVTTVLKSYCTAEKPLLGLCGNETFFDGFCYAVDPANFEEYPVVEFIIGGNEAIMSLDAHSYLQQAPSGVLYCSALRRSPEVTAVVFGTPIFFHYYMVFDQGHQTISYGRRTSCTDRDYILEIYAGDGQEGYVHRQLDEELQVIVRRYNDSMPQPGVPVDWSILAGKGKLVTADPTTGFGGIASATLQLGPDIGSNIVLVSIDNAFNSPVYMVSSANKSIAFYVMNSVWLALLLLALLVAVLYRRLVDPSTFEDSVKSVFHRMSDMNLAEPLAELHSDCEPPVAADEMFDADDEKELSKAEKKARKKAKKKAEKKAKKERKARASLRLSSQAYATGSPMSYQQMYKERKKEESASLLEWAAVHDQPVRNPSRRYVGHSLSENSALLTTPEEKPDYSTLN